MLKPTEREQLLEALRPPDGYDLDIALGTTFSLDLPTLLTLPIGFAAFDWQDNTGRPTADPMALLEAVRRYASRLTIFCQAGRIAVPKNAEKLYAYLEDSVYEVATTDRGGVFHPKVWVLRFVTAEAAVFYRVLVLSRNATADRSWDTLLVLEGEVLDRKKAIAASRPLADFVQALPKQLSRPLTEARREQIDFVQDELRRTRFTPPDGFDDLNFWPLGIANYQKRPFSADVSRLLIMSPFLSEDFLGRVQDIGHNNVLISRLDSLSAVPPERLASFEAIYCLNPDVDSNTTDESAEADLDTPLEGLHAKLYITESGWDATVWTGSANATTAAFERNVEFMVKLTGKKNVCGINAMLHQEKGSASLFDLLQEFKPGQDQTAVDLEQKQLEDQLNGIRQVLINARLSAKVTMADNQSDYRVEICCSNEAALPEWPIAVNAHCWPITLRDSAARPLTARSRSTAVFDPVAFETLTSFFAFELSISVGERTAMTRFVLNLPLEGVPADRSERLLRSLLGDSRQVIRFLYFLLADDDPATRNLLVVANQSEGSEPAGGTFLSGALLEMLLRTLHRQPERLDQVERLVRDLKQTAEGQALLPAGFEAIWGPIWQARRELQQ